MRKGKSNQDTEDIFNSRPESSLILQITHLITTSKPEKKGKLINLEMQIRFPNTIETQRQRTNNFTRLTRNAE